MTTHAARVWLTLDDIAVLMGLPEGHYIHAVDELPHGYIPGIALTIVSKNTPQLPAVAFSDYVQVMDLNGYRAWATRPMVVRSTLRSVETPVESGCADDCTHPAHQHGYTPQRAPVMQSFTPNVEKTWPKFPGEGLPITGEPVRGDPGDEDGHMGGPR